MKVAHKPFLKKWWQHQFDWNFSITWESYNLSNDESFIFVSLTIFKKLLLKIEILFTHPVNTVRRQFRQWMQWDTFCPPPDIFKGFAPEGRGFWIFIKLNNECWRKIYQIFLQQRRRKSHAKGGKFSQTDRSWCNHTVLFALCWRNHFDLSTWEIYMVFETTTFHHERAEGKDLVAEITISRLV